MRPYTVTTRDKDTIDLEDRAWLRSGPTSFARLFGLLLLFIFSTAYIAIVMLQYAEQVPIDGAPAAAEPSHIATVVVLLSLPLLFIDTVALYLLLNHPGHWQRLTWSATDGHWSGTRVRWLGLSRRVTTLQLEKLTRISAELGPEVASHDTAALVSITLRLSDKYGLRVEVPLAVEHVNRHAEAIDLALSLGRAAGFTAYGTRRNALGHLEVEMHTRGKAIPAEMRAIPPASHAPDYAFDRPAVFVPPYGPEVAEFSLDRFKNHSTKIAAWRPGERIQLLRPAPSPSELLTFAGAYAITTAAVVTLLVAKADAPAWRWFVPLLVAPVAAFLGVCVHRIRTPERMTTLDWTDDTATFRFGWYVKRRSLQAVHRIVLYGWERILSRKNGPPRHLYKCRLELEWQGGQRMLLVQDDEWRGNQQSQRERLEPLAQGLGKALGVNWFWQGYRKPRTDRVAGYVAAGIIGCLVCATVVFLTYGVWYQTTRRIELQAVANKITRPGVTVSQTELWIGSDNIFGDGWLITITDPALGDREILGMVTETILNLESPPLYGLDLSNSAVTDSGVGQLVASKELFYLNLRGTRITQAVMSSLARANVRCLDLRETNITLADLRSLSNNHALMALYISDTEITDEDVRLLDSVPQLDYVFVNDEATTRDVLARVNGPSGGAHADSPSVFDLRLAPPISTAPVQ